MKPFLAIDIETTGLKPETSLILQVAAIYVTEQQQFEMARTVNYKEIVGEPYALSMHPALLRSIAKGEGHHPTSILHEFAEFFEKCGIKAGTRITPAGKNLAGFDLPFLRHHGMIRDDWFSHRVLDVGPLYFPDFGYVPNLSEINKLLGRVEAAHDALADCRDVVAAVLAKVKHETKSGR